MDKFKLSSSSFLELKAELEAKKQAFQKGKSKGASSEKTGSAGGGSGAKGGLFKASVEPGGDLGWTKKAAAGFDEEEALLRKSRERLEEKAGMYEKYRLAALPEELREDVMVDFDRKFAENRSHVREEEEPSDADGEETEDEFGRTVKRPRVQGNVDALLSAAKEQSKADQHEDQSDHDYLSGDLNVTEKRSKGVGFYKFSADEDEKAVQLRELNRLRTDTVGSRNKAFIQAEQRRLMKEARLAKIEQQRSKKQPDPAD